MGDSSLFPKLTRVHLRKTTTQTAALNATKTIITWDGVGSHGYNDFGMWTSGNNYIDIPSNGVYYIAAAISFEATNATTGYRHLFLEKDDATLLSQKLVKSGNVASYRTKIQVSWVGNLTTADNIRVATTQTSGGSLGWESSLCWFAAVRLGNA